MPLNENRFKQALEHLDNPAKQELVVEHLEDEDGFFAKSVLSQIQLLAIASATNLLQQSYKRQQSLIPMYNYIKNNQPIAISERIESLKQETYYETNQEMDGYVNADEASYLLGHAFPRHSNKA